MMKSNRIRDQNVFRHFTLKMFKIYEEKIEKIVHLDDIDMSLWGSAKLLRDNDVAELRVKLAD